MATQPTAQGVSSAVPSPVFGSARGNWTGAGAGAAGAAGAGCAPTAGAGAGAGAAAWAPATTIAPVIQGCGLQM